MNLPLKIAIRYLFSKKKANFINIISWLALAGIAFGTAALVIILSVFNGLEDLNRSLFNTFDADLVLKPKSGKNFNINQLNFNKIAKVEGVNYITKTIEESALIKYADQQTVATIKGVDNTFLRNKPFEKSIVDGKFTLGNATDNNALIGIGIEQNLSISTVNFYTPLEFWYPSKSANLNLATENSFNKQLALPSAIFSIEQSYDNHVIVPIALADALFEKNGAITALEINLKPNVNPKEIKEKLLLIVNGNLQILTRDEQHSGLLKAIKLEKLFVFIALIFIIGIAALNIFFSLSMLVIEKTNDIKTLNALGAKRKIIGQIFKIEGFLIASSGAILGLILGYTICILQQKYGLLKMGMVSALVDSYPIRIEPADFIYTGISIFLITLIISQFPSKKAENIG